MPHGPESRRLPGRHEQVNPVPGIEREGEPAISQNPVHLVERGPKPCGVVVVAHRAPVPALVIHEVRRVGEDEIHAPARHRPHEGNAVALKDYITEGPIRIVGHVPDSFAGIIAGGSTPACFPEAGDRATARESWGQMTAGAAGLRASGPAAL